MTTMLVRYYDVRLKTDVETEAERGKTSAERHSVSRCMNNSNSSLSYSKSHHFHFPMVFYSKASFLRVGACLQKPMISDSPGNFEREKEDAIV